MLLLLGVAGPREQLQHEEEDQKESYKHTLFASSRKT
jgi:hypothetical protein